MFLLVTGNVSIKAENWVPNHQVFWSVYVRVVTYTEGNIIQLSSAMNYSLMEIGEWFKRDPFNLFGRAGCFAEIRPDRSNILAPPVDPSTAVLSTAVVAESRPVAVPSKNLAKPRRKGTRRTGATGMVCSPTYRLVSGWQQLDIDHTADRPPTRSRPQKRRTQSTLPLQLNLGAGPGWFCRIIFYPYRIRIQEAEYEYDMDISKYIHFIFTVTDDTNSG
ncbi:hypothetical protein C8F04DRAFT_1186288 [Mycena alexandri]|uniref:Uncharacterized protein n=1 Tax=Mycena alexandri TaxID=1745969 RepID=A0AAD6X159_9AGAR|nr:hypothetical protein C8F04DRAFT_1186288 [Mycena alexandri]